MALLLETGEGLANADSLVSLADVRAFASSRGATLPEDDGEVEVMVRVAHDYLASIETRFKGVRRNGTQSLPFPRTGITVFAKDWTNLIPTSVKMAVMALVVEQSKGNDILPSFDGSQVIHEKVGPIETKFAQNLSSTPRPTFTVVDAFLTPLFNTATLTRTVRV